MMGKQIKHDFNKPDTNLDASKNGEVDNIQQKTSQEIAHNNMLNPFAIATKNILTQKFGMTCNIREKQLSANFTTFHLTKKGVKPEAEGQVRITVSKDLNFNIQLNPYDAYGQWYFQGT